MEVLICISMKKHWTCLVFDSIRLKIFSAAKIMFLYEIQDPCRPGVKDAVLLCQKAGVKVFHKLIEICFVVKYR